MLLFLERFDDKYDDDNTNKLTEFASATASNSNFPSCPQNMTATSPYVNWHNMVTTCGREESDVSWSNIHNFTVVYIHSYSQFYRRRYATSMPALLYDCMIYSFPNAACKTLWKKVNTITANALLFKVAIWSNAPVLVIPKPREMD